MFKQLIQYIKPTFHYEYEIYHSSKKNGLFAGYKLYFGNEYIAMIDYGINYTYKKRYIGRNNPDIPDIMFVCVRDEFRHKRYGTDVLKYFENLLNQLFLYMYPSMHVFRHLLLHSLEHQQDLRFQ